MKSENMTPEEERRELDELRLKYIKQLALQLSEQLFALGFTHFGGICRDEITKIELD